MKILIFLNLGNIPMTEEMLLAKISKIALFHGGVLSQSQDNRSVWIVRKLVMNSKITIQNHSGSILEMVFINCLIIRCM